MPPISGYGYGLSRGLPHNVRNWWVRLTRMRCNALLVNPSSGILNPKGPAIEPLGTRFWVTNNHRSPVSVSNTIQIYTVDVAKQFKDQSQCDTNMCGEINQFETPKHHRKNEETITTFATPWLEPKIESWEVQCYSSPFSFARNHPHSNGNWNEHVNN